MGTTDPELMVEAFGRAAAGMESWDGALSLVARATRSRIGQIAVVDGGGLRLNMLSGTSADEERAYFAAGGPDPAHNPRTRAILTAPPLASVADEDFATPALVDRSPIYRTLFRDADVPFSLQVRADMAAGTVVLSLQRPGSSGHATATDRRLVELIAPAIGSAVEAGLALGAGADRDLLDVAEGLAGPAMLLGTGMAVIAMSAAAEAVLRGTTLFSLRRGLPTVAHPRGQAALEAAFRTVTGGPPVLRHQRRLVLANGREVLTIDLCPVPARLSGPLSAARALLTLRLPAPAVTDHSRGLVMDAYGLTASETEVALALADGRTLARIAADRGTAAATVRVQVRAIFDKTGLHRQADVALAVRAIASR